jgi:1-deoxy-D-xylulose-5-phosphate synthase
MKQENKNTKSTKSLLDHINSPVDLKELKLADLETLATEIRKLIIETVSRNGGHLASSLGVVELSIALHYVFDAPRATLDIQEHLYLPVWVSQQPDL